MRNVVLGGIFFLFLACFFAIIVEEVFLGGRRKRRLMREGRARAKSMPGSYDGGKDNAHHTGDRT